MVLRYSIGVAESSLGPIARMALKFLPIPSIFPTHPVSLGFVNGLKSLIQVSGHPMRLEAGSATLAIPSGTVLLQSAFILHFCYFSFFRLFPLESNRLPAQ